MSVCLCCCLSEHETAFCLGTQTKPSWKEKNVLHSPSLCQKPSYHSCYHCTILVITVLSEFQHYRYSHCYIVVVVLSSINATSSNSTLVLFVPRWVFSCCYHFLLLLVSAHLSNIHGVCGDDIPITHLLFGVHDPYICLLVMHHGRAIVRPPRLLQVWQNLQDMH